MNKQVTQRVSHTRYVGILAGHRYPCGTQVSRFEVPFKGLYCINMNQVVGNNSEENSMEKHEVIFQNLLEKRIITALEDRVIFEFSNHIDYSRIEFEYSELKSKVVRGRKGDPMWTNIGAYIVIGMVFLTFVFSFIFPDALRSSYYRYISLALMILALVAFSLRLIKYDCVWFDDNEGEYAFLIKLNDKNRGQGEKTIDFILEKINLHQ